MKINYFRSISEIINYLTAETFSESLMVATCNWQLVRIGHSHTEKYKKQRCRRSIINSRELAPGLESRLQNPDSLITWHLRGHLPEAPCMIDTCRYILRCLWLLLCAPDCETMDQTKQYTLDSGSAPLN
jgi:hypothetical protein